MFGHKGISQLPLRHYNRAKWDRLLSPRNIICLLRSLSSTPTGLPILLAMPDEKAPISIGSHGSAGPQGVPWKESMPIPSRTIGTAPMG